MLLFWIAFVLTRPLEANLGKVLTKEHERGGLAWVPPWTSAALLAALVALVVYQTVQVRRYPLGFLPDPVHRGAGQRQWPNGAVVSVATGSEISRGLSEISVGARNPARMESNSIQAGRLPVKTLAALGLGAFVSLATLGAVYSGSIDIGPGLRAAAGSGSAPNTVFKQPVVGQMNTGATATWTPPAAQPRSWWPSQGAVT